MTEDTGENSYRIVQCTESLLQRMASHEIYEQNEPILCWVQSIHPHK
jgi:hypothetical protein